MYIQTVQQNNMAIVFLETDFAGQRGRGDLALLYALLLCLPACITASLPFFLSSSLLRCPPLSTLIEITVYVLSFSSQPRIHLTSRCQFLDCASTAPLFSRCHNLVRGPFSLCSHIPGKFQGKKKYFWRLFATYPTPTPTHTTRLLGSCIWQSW